MKKLLLTLIFLSLGANAETISVQSSDYKEASKKQDRLVFSMASWKVGIFKSTFKSYVRDFKIDFDKKNENIENVKISFDVKSMDSDINARNEKMWEFCLDYKNHPVIDIELLDKIKIPSTAQVNATIAVRGKKHPILIQIDSKIVDGKPSVSGSAELSLKGLEIPDPSIAVASVEDKIKVEFNISD